MTTPVKLTRLQAAGWAAYAAVGFLIAAMVRLMRGDPPRDVAWGTATLLLTSTLVAYFAYAIPERCRQYRGQPRFATWPLPGGWMRAIVTLPGYLIVTAAAPLLLCPIRRRPFPVPPHVAARRWWPWYTPGEWADRMTELSVCASLDLWVLSAGLLALYLDYRWSK